MLFEAHLLPQFKHACRVIQEAFLFATPHDKIFTKCGRSVVTEILKVEIEEDIEGGGGGGCRKPHLRAKNWQIPKPKSIVVVELNSLRIRSGFQHGRRFFV